MGKIKNNTPTSKACPECGPGTSLVVKLRRRDGRPFIGCPNWPACSHTEELPEALKMQLEGQPTLFNFKEGE